MATLQSAQPVFTKMSTPLEVEFDRSVSGGIVFMKLRLKEMLEAVQFKNERAGEMEEEVKNLKERYRNAIASQKKMRRDLYEGEERLPNLDRDQKELQRRLYEKTEFLRELKSFKSGDSIEEAAKMDIKLADKKEVYKENYDKFQKARQSKLVLETKQELMDCRMRAVTSKLNALNSELHHLKVEGERQREENSRSAENAMTSSGDYSKLEQDMAAMRQRMLEATQKVNNLSNIIQNKETEIRSLSFNRLDMENTIKKILKKVQAQIERGNEVILD